MTYLPNAVSASSGGEVTAPDFKATGVTGASSPAFLSGSTTSGAPTTGTWAVGAIVPDHAGAVWVCTGAGTPGTWVQVSPGATGSTGATGAGVPSPLGTPGQIIGPVGAAAAWVTPVDRGGFTTPAGIATDNLLYFHPTAVTTLDIGIVGDSITDGSNLTGSPTLPHTQLSTDLTTTSVTVTAHTSGSSYSGTTTLDWAPSGTLDAAAVTAFASYPIISIMLGTNDANSTHNYTAATYRSQLRAIVNAWVGRGKTVFLHYSPYSTSVSESDTLLLAYQTVINGLVDGVRVRQGDTGAYVFFQNNTSLLNGADGIHPTQTGSNDLVALWAAAMQPVVQAITEETTLQPLTLGTNLSITSGVLNAAGGGATGATGATGPTGSGSTITVKGGATTLTGVTEIDFTGATVTAGAGTIAAVTIAGGALATATNALASDVTMTTINTFYDGPSVSLAAGTWLIIGTVTVVDTVSAAFFTAKLWDGTTVSSSAEAVGGNGGWPASIGLSAIVSPSTTTTYKISAANGTNSSTGKIKAAAPTNGAGNNASSLWAVKIG